MIGRPYLKTQCVICCCHGQLWKIWWCAKLQKIHSDTAQFVPVLWVKYGLQFIFRILCSVTAKVSFDSKIYCLCQSTVSLLKMCSFVSQCCLWQVSALPPLHTLTSWCHQHLIEWLHLAWVIGVSVKGGTEDHWSSHSMKRPARLPASSHFMNTIFEASRQHKQGPYPMYL